MDDPIAGPSIWTRLTVEDVDALRLAARRALLRAGAHPAQITEAELDKVIESRLESTLERVLQARSRKR